MSSTNKTSHYNLSQYASSDKPTYLVDYNTDMSNIDTGIYNAKSEADTNATSIGTLSNLTTTAKTNLVASINEVDGNADTANSNIGTLSSLTTTVKTDLVNAINEVDANADTANTNIGTLSGLHTTVKTSAVSAINEIVDNNSLKYSHEILQSELTVSAGTVSAVYNGYIAWNEKSDWYKCFIYFGVTTTAGSGFNVKIPFPTGFTAPSSAYTIAGAGKAFTQQKFVGLISLKVNTTNFEIVGDTALPAGSYLIVMEPFLYNNIQIEN